MASNASCAQAYLSSPAALPPADGGLPGAAAAAGSRDTSGRGRSVLPPGVWACEAFLGVRLTRDQLPPGWPASSWCCCETA
jgi:hypothetical protein